MAAPTPYFGTLTPTPTPAPDATISPTPSPTKTDISSHVVNPRGIAHSSTIVYISGDNDDKIFAFSTTGFSRRPEHDIDALIAAGNNHPRGIFYQDGIIWVADSSDAMVYAYDASSRQRSSGWDLDCLDSANSKPFDVWKVGGKMWVLDNQDAKIYAYSAAPCARDAALDYDTLSQAGNTNPRGMWSDGATMWVSDATADKIFAYDTITKAHKPSLDFEGLLPANTLPFDIDSDGSTYLRVIDNGQNAVYEYSYWRAAPPPEPAPTPAHDLGARELLEIANVGNSDSVLLMGVIAATAGTFMLVWAATSELAFGTSSSSAATFASINVGLKTWVFGSIGIAGIDPMLAGLPLVGLFFAGGWALIKRAL